MSTDEVMRWPRKGHFQLNENGIAESPWLGIEIERALHGESQISEVLGDNVEIRLSFGRSGE